jgi:hypothetical protein
MANESAAPDGAGHNTARLKDLHCTMVLVRIFVKGADR